MAKVKSTVRINTMRIKQLNQAAVTTLELTGNLLSEDIKRAKVIPKDRGTLEDGTAPVYVQSNQGKVSIVSSTLYARRLYYNPETVSVREYTIKKGKRAGQKVKSYIAHKMTFSKRENANAKDHWFEDWQEGGKNADFVPKTFKKIYKRLINT